MSSPCDEYTAYAKCAANCALCPRRCGVDRNRGGRGFCGETSDLRIAYAGLHRGEEPPLVGGRGSGTIFITGCNLKCIFCQNRQIAYSGLGRVADSAEFAFICLELQRRGAANINIVTGSHAIPAIAAGLAAAKSAGLTLPVLWNSSAYETVEALSLLDGLVDIYLPDLKTLDARVAKRFFTEDYPQTAVNAILYMLQKTPLKWAGEPLDSALLGGVIVRHLVLPGETEAAREVLRWFSKNAKETALLSLMTQYTPIPGLNETKAPACYLSKSENSALLSMLQRENIENGFIQEPINSDEWLPDFEMANPFFKAKDDNAPEKPLSIPVWHWRDGFCK